MRTAIIAALIFVFGIMGASATEIVKGEKLDTPVCGGWPGYICGDKEWCDYPDGATCGSGDHFGTCRTQPDFCTEQYVPVCGCDGETYSNACLAAAGGSDVAYPGKCR